MGAAFQGPQGKMPDYVKESMVNRAAEKGATAEEQKRIREALDRDDYQELERISLDITTRPPPPAPDLTDEVVRAAGRSERQRTNRGRKSTFLTGYGVDMNGVQKPKTFLGG